MATVTIHSDFRAQEKEICHCFRLFPFHLPWTNGTGCHNLSIFKKLIIYFNWRLIIYNIVVVFAIHWHESAMTALVSPIWTHPPTSLSTPSLRAIPVPQSWAPCLMQWTWTDDLFHIEHVSVLFSQTIPPLPSPTENKSLFFISMSLLLSHI